MHRYMRFASPFLLTLMILIGLTACGTSLEKPTGLEETDKPVELITEDRLDKKEVKVSNTEEAENTENDQKEDSTNKNIKEDKNEAAVKEDKKTTSKNKAKPVEEKEQSTSNEKNTKKSSKTSSANKTSESKSKNTSTKQTKEKPKKSAPPKEKTKKPVKKEENTKSTITHSIVISSSEVPLPATKMEITNEDTVLQALIEITMAKNIHMDYRGGQGATAYVQGMGNVYEFDRGQGSGWMYSINGIFPDRGAGVVPLCDGDIVEWLYTTDLGEDLGADLKPVRRDGQCP